VPRNDVLYVCTREPESHFFGTPRPKKSNAKSQLPNPTNQHEAKTPQLTGTHKAELLEPVAKDSVFAQTPANQE
jgi:hypothetical protein